MSSFLASLLNAIGQAASSLTISLSSESAAVVFPVLPSELMVSVNTNHGTVNINNFGDYLMMGKTGPQDTDPFRIFPSTGLSLCHDGPCALYIHRPTGNDAYR